MRGFTEGFTGVLWDAMEDLAQGAFTTGADEYEIDFLASTISQPPLPPVSPHFFEYRDLGQWFDDVGSSLSVVKSFRMKILFDLTTLEDLKSHVVPTKSIVFHAATEIVADNENIYPHCLSSDVWFQYLPDRWWPASGGRDTNLEFFTPAS